MISKHGIASASFDPARRPVAVFDWDNTVLKNDIGDATFAWMVQHDVIRQPPGKDWSATNSALTTDAKTALNTACDAAAAAGQPLPTSSTPACAAEIMNVYYNGKTAAGSAAWNGDVTTTINQPYAWVAQLSAGYPPGEIRDWARAAFQQALAGTVGDKQTVCRQPFLRHEFLVGGSARCSRTPPSRGGRALEERRRAAKQNQSP